jgi:poly(3-hydroxybutyrate) depolymerase
MKMISGRLLVVMGTLGIAATGCALEADTTPPHGSGGTSGTQSTGGAGKGGAGTGGSTAATGGSGGTSGRVGTGGTSGGGSAGKSSGGGAGIGGMAAGSGGVAAGGSGGTPSMGGAGSGGTAASGGASGTGTAATSNGGMAGASGAPAGAIPLGNPPVESDGCGNPTTVTNGKKTIQSSGEDRTYIIDIPTNYDMNKPYRLFYTSHWIGATSEQVVQQDYYFLKPLVDEPAIFVAPQSDGDRWQEKDHALFDDILGFVKENLCIDITRVFATGFSFGGMITYSLSVNHQKDIRAAVGIAPANYNIYVPPKSGAPIAWMQTTGMSDGTCPWVRQGSTTDGAKFLALEKAADNGCMVPADIPTSSQGAHLCYDFQGCGASYPTKACTFAGDHTNIARDPDSTTNWIAQESWDFFKQF